MTVLVPGAQTLHPFGFVRGEFITSRGRHGLGHKRRSYDPLLD